MADETILNEIETGNLDEVADTTRRVYEIGYHIKPDVKEEDVEQTVNMIRGEIEKREGSLIAEGAPQLMRLSYEISVRVGERFISYDRGYFGWIKFETAPTSAKEIATLLETNHLILRSIVFKTVREDTRAQLKTGLREVRRTDTIKSTPKREDEAAGETVSEADLDKVLEGITSE